LGAVSAENLRKKLSLLALSLKSFILLAHEVAENYEIMSIQEEITKRNEIWKSSNTAQRRVLVAKDVIERLNSNQISAEEGNWCSFPEEQKEGESVQEVILKGERCSACGIGSIFLSLISYVNQLTFTDKDLYGFNMMTDYENETVEYKKLKNVFSDSQLKLIEQSFEGGRGFFEFDSDVQDYLFYDDYDKPTYRGAAIQIAALRFYEKYPSENERLKAIMENIVENGGAFKLHADLRAA